MIFPFGWTLPKLALFQTGAAVLSHGKRCEKNAQRDEELCKLLDCLLLLPLEAVQQHEPKAEK
ncbi:MAG: hypothetical protein B6I36_10835 [Desulfobacteraceae bacterium 4572_35.1]|nr:MAG: hypothetical protein B6I36_10835 [Desulfobacteraceae bacterium 4572_35.1]